MQKADHNLVYTGEDKHRQTISLSASAINITVYYDACKCLKQEAQLSQRGDAAQRFDSRGNLRMQVSEDLLESLVVHFVDLRA